MRKKKRCSFKLVVGLFVASMCITLLLRARFLSSKLGESTKNKAAATSASASDASYLACETSKGRIVIHLQRDLAPEGAQRLATLAERGFFDQRIPFFRVNEWGVQLGADQVLRWFFDPKLQFCANVLCVR